MQQKTKSYNKIAIIGAGPAGVFSTIFASKKHSNIIYLFEKNKILKTLLPTGGGRCNLTYFDDDYKSFASNYPRGEKFLLSSLSKFSCLDTINFFNSINIKTYTQNDNRVFPVSNSSIDVRNKLCLLLKKNNIKIINKKVNTINILQNGKFIIDNIIFDSLVIAIGGHSNIVEINSNIKHNIIEFKPSLCSLSIKEDYLYDLSGVTLKNVSFKLKNKTLNDDLLFCHNGLSGPLIYKVSSYFANYNFPYIINLNLLSKSKENFEFEIIDLLYKENNRLFLNTLSKYLPKSFILKIFEHYKIDINIKNHEVNKNTRKFIVNLFCNFVINVISCQKGNEVVSCGGFDLNEINAKNFESKKIKNLYFCGEVLNIDGLCGGFNLQNCWTSGYIVGNNLSLI